MKVDHIHAILSAVSFVPPVNDTLDGHGRSGWPYIKYFCDFKFNLIHESMEYGQII